MQVQGMCKAKCFGRVYDCFKTITDVDRQMRQSGNTSTSGSSSGPSNGGQSQQVMTPQQLINPGSSGSSSSSSSSGGSGSTGSSSASSSGSGTGSQFQPQQQLTNPNTALGSSGSSSQQLTQQMSPSKFLDPSFQSSNGIGGSSGGNSTSQQPKGPNFVDPSIFFQATGGQSGYGLNANNGGVSTGSSSSGSQLFQPPQQFFGQTGNSSQFNFFNPASFINGRK